MTRILGIDLITGSYVKTEMHFAMCLVDTLNQSVKTCNDISESKLIELLSANNIDIIVVDHFQEILHCKKLFEYLADVQYPQTRQLFDQQHNKKQVYELARQNNISLRNKPDALKTAIIVSFLAEKNGQPVQIWREGEQIMYSLNKSNSTTKNILNSKVKSDQKESTHRFAHKEVGESAFVKSVDNVIGYGKEAIVYQVRDIHDRQCVVKVFKTYSPIARRIKSETYKAKSAHIPLLMARDEAKYLKILADNNIPCPKYYFRDDTMVGMEMIIDENSQKAPTLADLKSKEIPHSTTEDLLYQSLDNLYNLADKVKLVHGDYSANNLLVKEGKLIVIDLSQAIQINTNTFVDTPQRVRMDKALDGIFRDLDGILTFFETKFRVVVERDVIFYQFLNIVPDIFESKVEFIQSKWKEKFVYT